MTNNPLSRRERKALRKAGQKPSKPLVSVDTKGMEDSIKYMAVSVIAVFVFPFWLLWQNFREWREERR